jgi:hypothetical protein
MGGGVHVMTHGGKMRHYLFSICIAISLVLTAISGAFAGIISDGVYLGEFIGTENVDYLDVTLDPEYFLEGCYDVGYVGSAASHTNLYMGDSVIFSTAFSTFADTAMVEFIEETSFHDGSDGTPVLNINDTGTPIGGIVKLLLLNDWVIEAGKSLAAGILVIGFGDGAGDRDYNDMVITAVEGPKAPIPFPIIMLASGILGLVGLRSRAEE